MDSDTHLESRNQSQGRLSEGQHTYASTGGERESCDSMHRNHQQPSGRLFDRDSRLARLRRGYGATSAKTQRQRFGFLQPFQFGSA